MQHTTLPVYQDVQQASERIAQYARQTPVLTSRTADEQFAASLFLKAENFQRMGAFKFRGAINALLQFSAAQRAAGVITFSSGNHAQAIALAAKLLGMTATIVMPQDAPQAKVAATKDYGGHIVYHDRYREDREQIARDLRQQQGLTLIPPYDHPHVIAGQGSVANELFAQVGALDALFVPLGGGGLLAGCALAARVLSPGCKVYGVEPVAGNDGQQSLRCGTIVHIATPDTLADGAQTQHLGQFTFPIIQANVDDVLTVSDDALVDAMRFFAQRMKLVVEPTGCLGFAAARAMQAQLHGKRVGIVISGGNVDLAHYASLLAG